MVNSDLDLGHTDPINELDLDFNESYHLPEFQNPSFRIATCIQLTKMLTDKQTNKQKNKWP